MNPLVYNCFCAELVKLAENDKARARKKKVLKGLDSARPYAHRAFVGGMPGGLAGGWVAKSPKRIHRLAGVALGGSVAAGDKYLENLSKKRGYKGLLKNYREEAEKTAKDIGVDLRFNGMAKIPRPDFAPPQSLTTANSSLKKDQASFKFNAGRSGVPTPPSNVQATTVAIPNPGAR